MKKTILIASLAFVALAACTKNEINPVEDRQNVTYQTVVGTLKTRALIDGVRYESTAPSFGTAAFLNADDFVADEAGLYIPESEVSYQAPYWTTATPYYWPKVGKLTFFSYSPYTELNAVTEITAANGVVISNWDVDANQDVDVMVADMVKQQTANGSNGGYEGVPTVFRHKLAQVVRFSMLSDKAYSHTPHAVGDIEIIVRRISVNNLNTVGTYTGGNTVSSTAPGNWSAQSTPKSYVWYEDATGTVLGTTAVEIAENGAGADGYILVLPQSFAGEDATISVDYILREYHTPTLYVDSAVKTAVGLLNGIGDMEYRMNTKISYTITMSVDKNRIYWAPSVVDWDNADNNISF